MWADSITLRLDDLLVGVRCDTASTIDRLRAMLPAHVDDSVDVPWAFSVQLEEGPGAVRALPQLRIGSRLLTRSRDADDVVVALVSVLGGLASVRATVDRDRGTDDAGRLWMHLRAFATADDDRVVLVDATQPALVANSALRRAGVRGLPVWSVGVDAASEPAAVTTPSPLDAVEWAAGTVATPAALPGPMVLAGLVALDVCGHEATTPEVHARHLAEHHGHTPAGRIARFAARHPSPQWFRTIDALADAGRVALADDEGDAATAIVRLLTDAP
ncbi:MAG: hypothetical protein AAFY28_16860 [Actinomycetota bacterium]